MNEKNHQKMILRFVVFTLVIPLAFFSLPIRFTKAVVMVTPATGSSAISADTTDGTYTSLTGPVISEEVTADIGIDTIILNVPSGFIFDTGGTVPTVLVTRTAGSGTDNKNINDAASGSSLAVTGITTTQITFTVTDSTSGGVTNLLTWQDVRVRPSAGTPLASGNITKSGTSAINGVTGETNLGTLTEVAGAKSQLVITTQPSSSVMVATDFGTKPVIAVRDQFGNTATSDSVTTITHMAVLSTQVCGGTAGSGTLISTPASGAMVSSGIMTYTAMQYSAAESIKICFASSGITPALSNVITVNTVADTTAPAAISDLAVSNPTISSIGLSWTSPGDDNSSGTATSYDIRYSISEVTDESWSSATPVLEEPTPLVAGTLQSMTVTGLSASTTYFFAIKTSDEAPNESGLSNVPSLATTDTPDTTDPVITLNGASEVTLTIGGVYSELGATAVDAVDGSVAVEITGSVDTEVIGDYTITYTATDAANNTATATRTVYVVTASTPPPSSGGGGGGGVTPITVTFSGQAYPGGTIEVLRKNIQDALFQIIPTESASIKEDGTFEINHAGLVMGKYLYVLQVKDKDGRKITLSFDVNLLIQNNFAVKDILIPPTIELKNTLLLRTDELRLIGYAAPGNTIEAEIDGVIEKGTASAGKTGYYTFVTSVGPLAVGTHYARVRQVDKDGKKSDFSQIKSFKKSLLLELKADFNNDGKADITDWSIFLFRWGSQDQKLRSSVDMDGNGKVDIFDLSIFLKTIQI